MRARWSVLWLPPSVLSSRFPQARYTTVVRLRVPIMPRKRKKCWTADALCRLDPSLTPQYDSELDPGSLEALIPRDVESSEEDRPFLPRFFLQEVIFAHSPYGGGLSQPTKPAGESPVQIRLPLLARNFGDRMQILPVRELAAFPRCSVCEQLQAQERSPARWCLSAPTLLDGSR